MKKILNIISIIIIISIAIFSALGCEYLIQLPKETSETERSAGRKKEVTLYKEINAVADEKDTMVIVAISGPQAEAAKEIKNEFEELYGMKTVVFDMDVEMMINVLAITLPLGTESPIDIIIFPYYLLGLIEEYMENLEDEILDNKFVIEDYFPEIFNRVSKWKGQIKGIPVYNSIFTILFREEVFLDLNIPLENFEYDDYCNYLKEISNNQNSRYAIGFDVNNLNIYWGNRLWSLGGFTTTEDWQVTVNSEESNEAYEMLKCLKDNSDNDIFEKETSEIISDFLLGRSVIYEGFPDLLFSEENRELIGNDILKIGLLPIPSGPAGSFAQISANILGFVKKSRYAEMDWNWIELYTSKEKSKLFLDKFGLIPARMSTYEDQYLINKYEHLERLFILLNNANIKTRYKSPASYVVWDVMLNEELKDSLSKDKSPQEAMKDIEEKLIKLLKTNMPFVIDYPNEEVSE